MVINMNIYQMECFLALASTLNYTKASKKQHMTQPNFSKTISNLEQEVGTQLVQRSTRSVRITAAGEVFAQEAAKLVLLYRDALSRTRDVGQGINGTIGVGFLGTAMVSLLPKIFSKFRERHNDIQLNLVDYTYSPLMELLANDQIDIAFLPDMELEGIPGLKSRAIYSDDMCLVMNKNHPMADESIVDLEDFKSENFVLVDSAVSNCDSTLVIDICLGRGFMPHVVSSANTLNSLLMMVECNIGVSILAKHMQQFATDSVSFVKIRGYDKYFKVVAAWRHSENQLIPKLLDVIGEVC